MKSDPKLKITVDLDEVLKLKDLPEGLAIEGPCVVYVVTDRYVTRAIVIDQDATAVLKSS